MRIDAQLQPEDLAGALRLHRRLRPVARFVFIVIPVVWVMHALWRLWDMRQMGLLFSGIALFVGIAVAFFTERRLALRKLRLRCALSAARTITIGENGIVFVTERGRKSLPWLHFTKYKQGNEMVLLYPSAADYLIFPHRWFTPEQREEFESYLRSEVGESV